MGYRLVLILLALTVVLPAQAVQKLPLAETVDKLPETADVILLNGAIYTGTRCLFYTPIKNAPCEIERRTELAVKNGRIVWISRNANSQILGLRGKDTQVIDLRGAFVMPGFNDAHLHLANGGFEKLNVNLIGTKTLAEMQSRIAERVKTAKGGEWITGRGWDHTKWDVKETPTRADIDKVTGDHPAAFTRVDGHIAIVNSAALKAAGITRDTKDPDGGKIDRDANGEATGILRETAMGLVGAKIPPPTPEQRRRAIGLALADAAQWGITSAQDNSSWEDFLIYEQLQKEGKLTLRITEWLPFDAPVKQLEQMRAHHDAKDPMLHTGMLKGFMDGSLGSRTAALLAPYADDHSNSGIPRYTEPQLNTLAAERQTRGFQVGLHAIGDAGTEMALDAFAFAKGKNMAEVEEPQNCKKPCAKPEFRNRIEHAQVITPAQFDKFKKLGVIASMQPNHLLTDMNWAESRIGPARAKTSYPWKQFLDHDVLLAFGTDYPVEPITPFRGLYAAVTRMNEEGTKKYPGEPLTIDQAIAAYTTGSAYAEFAEKDKGTLAPGMWADFVVLDRDITRVKPAEILKTKVLRTVVAGKTVYEAK
jgi:predicted amidohydrolase YtcJ